MASESLFAHLLGYKDRYLNYFVQIFWRLFYFGFLKNGVRKNPYFNLIPFVEALNRAGGCGFCGEHSGG